MFASRVLITAGTPGHMYLDDKQAKWLEMRGGQANVRFLSKQSTMRLNTWVFLINGDVLESGSQPGTYVIAW